MKCKKQLPFNFMMEMFSTLFSFKLFLINNYMYIFFFNSCIKCFKTILMGRLEKKIKNQQQRKQNGKRSKKKRKGREGDEREK